MPKIIPELSELAALIQPDVLAAHGFPKPKRVVLLERQDSAGEDSYYVYLVYPNKVPDEALRHSKTRAMQEWVRQTIVEHAGYDRYPYIRVCRPIEVPRGF